jgi:hypothetical protein
MSPLTRYQTLGVHVLLAASTLLAPSLAWAQAAGPAVVPAAAQENFIESVSIRSETSDQVVFDVAYQYSGDHAEAFVSIVMSNEGTPSLHFAHRPARVDVGRGVATVELTTNTSKSFSTPEVIVSMYQGGQEPFLQRRFAFSKTWARPGSQLPIMLSASPLGEGGGGRPAAGCAPTEGAQGVTSRRVSANGAVELTYADGSGLILTHGSTTRISPSGQKSTFMAASVQPSTPPSAPDLVHSKWLEYQSEQLLSIIRALVGNDEASLQNYLSSEGASPYQQINDRTRTIGWLTQP